MKKIYIRLAVTLILFSGSFRAIGQDSLAIAEEMYSMGMELYQFGTGKQAREMFVQAIDFNPKLAKAHLMAGKSILRTVHKEESLPYLQMAYKLDPEIDGKILFLIGEAHQYSEQFDEAISFFQLYRKQLAKSLSFDKARKIYDIEWKIFECRNAKIYLANEVDVDIINLSGNINSEYADYAPLITADEKRLIFTSRRPHHTANSNLAEDFEYYEDIYQSLYENGQWQPAAPFDSPINGDFHNSDVGLSPDGTILYIYTDENGGDILESDFIDGKWTAARPIKGLVNTPYLENSATITEDKNTIYFTSNKPGGYGGTDIYKSQLDGKGRWGSPVNLGNKVNTERDEEAPFISKSGIHLYFSSNGHAGMGDLDLYIAEKEADSEDFKEPVNLGYPINSVENDVFFVLNANETHAYYSSVKTSSKGEQDIYKINMERWEPINIDSLRAVEVIEIEPFIAPLAAAPPEDIVESEISLLLTILDEKSLDTLTANVALIEQKNQTVLGGTLNSQGSYQIKFTNKDYTTYRVKIIKEDYLPYESMIHVIGQERRIQKLNETVALRQIEDSFTGIMNVYFGLDSDQPNGFEDIQYLEYLMKDSPKITVEIGGHTDNSGPVAYNKDLSQRRANSIKNYLTEHGIDASRINAVGYGVEKPIGDNGNRVGRRLNRRTEFKILQH
jgi:outer membrane protein OmpA-like peptidoglycan-associated protein